VFGSIFAKGGLYDDVKTTTELKPEVKKIDSESDEDEPNIPTEETPKTEEVPVKEEEKAVEGEEKAA
jgi:hypothetical protein